MEDMAMPPTRRPMRRRMLCVEGFSLAVVAAEEAVAAKYEVVVEELLLRRIYAEACLEYARILKSLDLHYVSNDGEYWRISDDVIIFAPRFDYECGARPGCVRVWV